MIRLNDIKVSVDYTSSEIKEAIVKKIGIKLNYIKSFDIVRRSIDARYSNVRFSLGLMVEATGFDEQINNNIDINLLNLQKQKK